MLAGVLIALIVGAEPVQSDTDDGGTLLVRVTAEGRPVDGAAVSTRCAADPIPVLTVGGQATLRGIRGHHCWVSAEKSGFVSDDFLFSMSSGSGEAELRLFPRVDLTVIARTPDGGVLDGIEAQVSQPETQFFRTGEQVAIRAGPTWIAAGAYGYGRAVTQLELVPGARTVELVLPGRRAPPVRITGRVLTAAGLGVGGVIVRGTMGKKRAVANTSDDGTFELGFDETGQVVLSVDDSLGEGSVETIVQAPAANVVLRLERRGVLEVTFIADGVVQPIRFSLESVPPRQDWIGYSRFHLSGLPTGTYRIKVRERGWAPVEQMVEVVEGIVTRTTTELERIDAPDARHEEPGLHRLFLIR